ncbi:MAG: hypothetical protein FWG30_08685 [Eubacteriaceae bacterium]|nr:hypothetical protein [Eubacteriaceae bacterium]
MKNQYVGDIGDYVKLGLLRSMEDVGYKIGINWYLTPDDDDKKDGRHIKYLSNGCDTNDNALFASLYEIVRIRNDRSVNAIINSDLLYSTKHYSRPFDITSSADREDFRADWHANALMHLKGSDIVFLDPDNGFLPESINATSKAGNKYAEYFEAADYFHEGSTVIVYCHRDRSPEEAYLNRIFQVKDYIDQDCYVMSVKSKRYSVRDFVFIMQPGHAAEIIDTIEYLQDSGWDKYIEIREL